jgi:endoglucanase
MDKKFFDKITPIISVSGYEEDVQKVTQKEWEKWCDKVEIDPVGNLIGMIKGKGPKIMLMAHSDEVGFIVSSIDEDGFIWFQPIGDQDPQILPSNLVKIKTKRGIIYGIAAKKDPFVTEEWEKVSHFNEQWIDIGARSKEEAEKYVSIGDPIVMDRESGFLLGNYYFARAVDDNIGIFILTEILKKMCRAKKKPTIFAVSSVQEEVGSRGSRPVTLRIQPDYAIIVDTIPSSDTPFSDKSKQGDIKIGYGPVLTRGGGVTDPTLFELFSQTAKRYRIPLQIEAPVIPPPSDITEVQITGVGVRCCGLSIPVRYPHYPAQVFCWKDVENYIKLLTKVLLKIKS